MARASRYAAQPGGSPSLKPAATVLPLGSGLQRTPMRARQPATVITGKSSDFGCKPPAKPRLARRLLAGSGTPHARVGGSPPYWAAGRTGAGTHRLALGGLGSPSRAVAN